MWNQVCQCITFIFISIYLSCFSFSLACFVLNVVDIHYVLLNCLRYFTAFLQPFFAQVMSIINNRNFHMRLQEDEKSCVATFMCLEPLYKCINLSWNLNSVKRITAISFSTIIYQTFLFSRLNSLCCKTCHKSYRYMVNCIVRRLLIFASYLFCESACMSLIVPEY